MEFVLCNAKTFFDNEQVFNKKFHLLLIESHVSNKRNELEDTIISFA